MESAKIVKSYITRAYSSFVAHVFDIPSRLLAFLCLLTLLAIPICWINKLAITDYLPFLTVAGIWAILGASWDLLVGRTGQVSLGHAFFYAIGAYIPGFLYEQLYGFSELTTIPVILIPILVIFAVGAALALLKGLRRFMRIFLIITVAILIIGAVLALLIGFWIKTSVTLVTVPISVIIGTVLALLIGLPALRVKGPYLGIVTMCIPLIMYNLARWAPLGWLFHGERGVETPSLILYPRGTTVMVRTATEYYVGLAILFFSAVILYKVASSKTGIVFVSILDNELAAKACGINVTKYKLLSFAISGLFGTLSGCVLVQLMVPHRVTPDFFSLTNSFLPIVMTYLGGIGTIYGPVAGAYIYEVLDYALANYAMPQYILPALTSFGLKADVNAMRQVFFAVLVIIMMIKWPRGIARTIVDKLDDLAKLRDIEERGPRIWKKYKKEQKEGRLLKIFSRFKKKQEEKEVKT
jgi:branched-chain amino acid transport system permease protein